MLIQTLIRPLFLHCPVFFVFRFSFLFSLFSLLFTLFSFLFSLFSFLFSLFSLLFTLFSFLFTLFSVLFSLFSCLFSLFSFLFSLFSFLFSLLSFLFSLFSFLFPLFSFLFSLFSLLFSLYSFLFTLFSFCKVIKYQIVESPGQSTQVRQRSMKCDTQLFYGASGPTRVKGDGSCRANECTCALQGHVQTDTQQGYQQRVLKTQTWDPTLSNISRHRCTTTDVQPHLGNKVNCD